jgi:hypothetical protein
VEGANLARVEGAAAKDAVDPVAVENGPHRSISGVRKTEQMADLMDEDAGENLGFGAGGSLRYGGDGVEKRIGSRIGRVRQGGSAGKETRIGFGTLEQLRRHQDLQTVN